MKIIINGDDLGISEMVNASIFGLMEKELVTSASLLMNAPAVEAAAARLGNYPHCSFGVHLNVTEFLPLTKHPGLKPLLNGNGEFAENIRSVRVNHAVREGVYAEWCAQLDRAMLLGVPVSHIDSHHHAHTVPGLLSFLKRVQRTYGIRKVRLTRNFFGSSESKPMVLLASKAMWNFMLRHWYPTRTTDYFASFAPFNERLHAGLELNGTIELACHPGGEGFRTETAMLSEPWKAALPRNAQLITYNDL